MRLLVRRVETLRPGASESARGGVPGPNCESHGLAAVATAWLVTAAGAATMGRLPVPNGLKRLGSGSFPGPCPSDAGLSVYRGTAATPRRNRPSDQRGGRFVESRRSRDWAARGEPRIEPPRIRPHSRPGSRATGESPGSRFTGGSGSGWMADVCLASRMRSPWKRWRLSRLLGIWVRVSSTSRPPLLRSGFVWVYLALPWYAPADLSLASYP